jgi:hypothetical protein
MYCEMGTYQKIKAIGIKIFAHLSTSKFIKLVVSIDRVNGRSFYGQCMTLDSTPYRLYESHSICGVEEKESQVVQPSPYPNNPLGFCYIAGRATHEPVVIEVVIDGCGHSKNKKDDHKYWLLQTYTPWSILFGWRRMVFRPISACRGEIFVKLTLF